jgi:toxin ParE1/3/4
VKKYVITELAATDLLEIRDYIAEDNKTAAKKVLSEFKEATQKIARNPQIGHVREELSKEARLWPVRSYLIVYLPEDPVIIIRVLHGARELTDLL